MLSLNKRADIRTPCPSYIELEDLSIYLKSDFMTLKDIFLNSVFQLLVQGQNLLLFFFLRHWLKFVVYNSTS